MSTIYPTPTIEVYMQDDFYYTDGSRKQYTDDSYVAISGKVYVDLSADVMSTRTLKYERGIPRFSVRDHIASTGTASFYLKNDGNSASQLGYYSPDNANVRTGWMEDLKMRISLSDATYDSGTVTPRWYGWIDKIYPPAGKYGERYVKVDCKDYIEELNRNEKTSEVATQIDVTSDEIYTAVIAAMPRQPEGTSFSTGVDTLPYALHRSGEGSGSGYEEISRVSQSTLDYVFMDKDGQLASQNRHDRPLDTTIQFTLAEANIQDVKRTRDRGRGIDQVTTRTYPPEIGTGNETAYTLQNPIRIGPDETYTLEFGYKDPNSQKKVGLINPVTLAAGTHYKFGSNPNGSSQNLNAGLTVVSQDFYSGRGVIVFRNDSGRVGFLNVFVPEGILIRTNDPVESTLIINTGGNSTETVELPYQDSEVFAFNVRYMVKGVYDNTDQVESVKVNLNDSTLFGYYMGTDTGQRIALSETVTGLSATEFFLNYEKVTYKNKKLDVTYSLAPTITEPAFIWGETNWGEAYWRFSEG